MLELLSADYQPYPIYKVTRHFLIVGQDDLTCQSLLLHLRRGYTNFQYDLLWDDLEDLATLRQAEYHAILLIDKKPFLKLTKIFDLFTKIDWQLPLILITENLDENTVYNCWQAGVVDCIEFDQLFTLPRLIERSLLTEQLQQSQQASILQLQQCRKMQNIANQIITKMSDSLILSEVLQSTVDQLHDVLGVDRCLIFQADDQQQMYAKHISEATLNKQSLLGVYCDFYRFYYPQLSAGKPLVISTFPNNLPTEVVEAGEICELQSLMIIPLFYQNIYLGGISLHQCQTPREWLDWEIELVKMVANHCAIAIHQAETYQILQSELKQRQTTELALRESEQRFRSLIENATDLIIIIDINYNFQYVSPSVQKIFGEQSGKLYGGSFFTNIHPDDLPMVNHALEKAIMSPIMSQPPLEYRLKNNAGEWHILECVITNLLTDPTVNGIVINSYDITRQKIAEKQLLYDALHDSLTNLPNRSLFMDRLEQAIKYTERRKDYLFAVLLLDIDRFKFINESLGHEIGDQLLISITERLVNSLRLVDTVARLGGDEFALLLENICGVSDVLHIVKRIQENIMQPIVLGSHEVFITASIGIVLSSTSDGVANHILRDADTAMYCAKSLGRGGYQIFCTSMHTHALNLLQLENDLRRALDSVKNNQYSINSQFRVYYQLIVSLVEAKIIGFEALARWHHPERGMISPGEFIPIAEETGLIVPLGLLVLKEACHQLYEWQQLFPTDPPLTISVNLSVKQFSQPDLLERIDEILAETKIDGCSLKLEITESALMDEHESVMNILQGLKARNIQLCIDDFGTGYSSLSYLHRFPLNTLKIDRSFVTRMGMDNQIGEGNIDPIEIVKSIITLSHNLGIDVIAEGVETSEQMCQLQDLQCEYGQGFFFSKPIDKHEATILLQNGISHLLAKPLESYEEEN
jgi:diguanylate cyclase (GGDEF)-like protein/PAS domain S-box-containing protein